MCASYRETNPPFVLRNEQRECLEGYEQTFNEKSFIS